MPNGETLTFDVAIVGCGPTGLALGGLLANRGIRVGMLERSQSAVPIPRATHLDDEVLRIFQALGVADELEPTMYLPAPYELLDEDWNVFRVLPLSKELGDQGWHRDYMFHQPQFEALMRERLSASEHAELYLGWSADEIEQREDDAVVRAREVEGAGEVELAASFVVGCDGARSTVREAMRTTLEDLHGTQRWLVTDSLLDEGVDDVTDRLFSYCPPLPQRALTYVTTGDRRRRVEFKIKPGEDWRALEDVEAVWELLGPFIPRERATLERADVYEFNALIADEWRAGRLFLAGDAAHQMPPKTGQGLCSGFRDAINLAWKLEHCLAHPEADALLDSYESERRPHAKHWIEMSNSFAKAIEEHNLGGAGEPAEPLPDEDGPPPPRPKIGPGLSSGFPHGGELSVQPLGSDGTRLDDRVGSGWTIVAEPALLEAQSDSARGLWDSLGAVAISPAEAHYEEWLAQDGSEAAVIRPDRYLLGTAGTPAELEQMAAKLSEVLELDA